MTGWDSFGETNWRFLDVLESELDYQLFFLTSLIFNASSLRSPFVAACVCLLIQFSSKADDLKEDVLAASRISYEEIEIKIACYEGYVSRKHVADFLQEMKKKYQKNIKLNVQNIDDEEQTFNSLKRNQYHVVSPGIDIYDDERFDLINKNLVLPVNLDWIPNYSELIAFRQSMPFLGRNKETFGVPFVSGIHGLMFDKKALKVAPTSLKELLTFKPKSYSITNYPAHIGYIVAILTGHVGDDVFTFERLTRDKVFMASYGQIVRGAENHMPGIDRAQDLTNNIAALGLGFAFADLREKGQDWTFADTKEGHLGWLDSWSIVSGTEKDPIKLKIAHEFINFAISAKYQKDVVVRQISGEPVNKVTLNMLDQRDLKIMPGLKNIDHWEKKRVYLRPLSVKNRNGFRLLYSRHLSQKAEPLPLKASPKKSQ